MPSPETMPSPTQAPRPTAHKVPTPVPWPTQANRSPERCKCGQPVEVRLCGSWFSDGEPRGYCLECHKDGCWRVEQAMRERDELLFLARATLGRFLLCCAIVWALGWVGGSDHPSEAGEPALWPWLCIAPLALLGYQLAKPNRQSSKPNRTTPRKKTHE